jgi:pimeloyl-ACP methyl ester carboxylesterase
LRKIYFLSGLGSHRLYLKDLQKYFSSIHLIQIDLPGHGLNYDLNVQSLEDLEKWFLSNINEEKVTVVGHSLGADLLVHLSKSIKKIKNIILLDGGIFSLNQLNYDFDKEITDVITHLKNQTFDNIESLLKEEKKGYRQWTKNLEEASIARMYCNCSTKKYEMALNQDSIKNLLSLRRKIKIPDFSNIEANILILLPSIQDKFIKQIKIQNIPKTIETHTIPNSGHDIYLDNPEAVNIKINEWLKDKS